MSYKWELIKFLNTKIQTHHNIKIKLRKLKKKEKVKQKKSMFCQVLNLQSAIYDTSTAHFWPPWIESQEWKDLTFVFMTSKLIYSIANLPLIC